MSKRSDKEIVACYFRGEYASIRDYANDFSKVHKTIDWYEFLIGKKRKHRKQRLKAV